MRASALCCPCCEVDGTTPELKKALIKLEALLGTPLTITSGYRCEKHNQDLIDKGFKASQNSYHLKGMAIDIHANDELRKRILAVAPSAGFNGGVGVGSTFIHLDLGPQRHWTY